MDRHPKWTPVEPGTVIPAGQPFARRSPDHPGVPIWVEHAPFAEDKTLEEWWAGGDEWFVDSSWRPPLVLPDEPTWGIAVTEQDGQMVGQWYETIGGYFRSSDHGSWVLNEVTDFIPLTAEQVARIEAPR